MNSDSPISQSQVAPDDSACAVAIAAEHIRRQLLIRVDDQPKIGVILGSGLGAAANSLLAAGGLSIAYEDIPGMPSPLINGHAGRLVLGRIEGNPVAMLQGRVHYYEGHSAAAVEFGTQLLHGLGVKTLLITNAAGGIRAGFEPGDLMIINGHLRPIASHFETHQTETMPCSLSGYSARGRIAIPEAPDLLWNEDLRQEIRQISSPLNIHEGVYTMMLGPNYETPAEIRMLRCLGADAVGMSTVPEALAAASLGMRVLGVSCITNIAAGLSAATLSHLDVTETAAKIESPFADWLWDVIHIIGQNVDPDRQEKATLNPFRK